MKYKIIFLVVLALPFANDGYGQKKIKLKEKDSKFGFYQGNTLVSDTVY